MTLIYMFWIFEKVLMYFLWVLFMLPSAENTHSHGRAVTWRPHFVLIIWPTIDSRCHCLKFNTAIAETLLLILHLSGLNRVSPP